MQEQLTPTIDTKPLLVHNPSETVCSVNESQEVTDKNLNNRVQTLPEFEIPQRPRHLHPISMQKQLGIFGSNHGSKNATLDRYFGTSKLSNVTMNSKE